MTRTGRARPRERGVTLVEVLIASAIGLLVLAACTAAVAAAGRFVVALGARAEAEDTAQLAVEAFRFDLRRAGFDPAAAGIQALVDASSDQVAVHADLDGDGTLDGSSEEVMRWVCATSPPRLSRVIGAQSLPVAAPVTGCGFRYLDADGSELAAAGGLAPAQRALVRRVVLFLAVEPQGGGALAMRAAGVALRSPP
jgi:prepilin-type N-terminal cleavage/methylation domain-containing protein